MSFGKAQTVPEIQMLHKIVFSEPTFQASQYDETKGLTSILGIDLPCSHNCRT
jgi:hypothetical protein